MVSRPPSIYLRVRLLLMAALALPLSACNSDYYNKSLLGQITDLKQEVQQLREENRLLMLALEEVKIRYGINLDQLNPESQPRGSIFERVFSDPENTPTTQ